MRRSRNQSKLSRLAGELSSTAAAVERAKSHWLKLNARKRAVAVQMGELEALEEAVG
jgi:hypothetical protein